MELVRVAHKFLVYYCITRGRVQSRNSWWKYGQDLYDYFGYLEAGGIDWRSSLATTQHSVIAAYRDWSFENGLTSKTINGRLRTIIQFYQFAYRKKWISSVPFDIESVIVNKPKGFLAHTDRSGNTAASPNVMLKERFTHLQILTEDEVKRLMSHKTFVSQHLIYRMAVQTGMRKEELMTFPSSYITDPKSHRGRAVVRVRLKPGDMRTKGSRERDIDIPMGLYERLWQYKIHERNQLLLANESPERYELFINRFGRPYSIKGSILNKELKEITCRKDISLHDLRHTYATFKLYGLRSNPNYRGEPLVYIQDRLGHSSINTTRIYLHYIERLESDLMTEYDEDIDRICMEAQVAA
ncbi:tyrosine-type recombinase/integrase [Spongiibacter sp. KMU-158]|uniref:Tyrosine-type recombinase/integrase n=1 Tax=Spongiibacter pelagi TaxID=2760804 RepID=A0A927C6K6_9GAMM|nr:tyrosine-type recombinase/integrase [Spongiibacter pelagi]MBD2860320.1 tyrosine-type recombinase/integrase [Spongiibacter pelagi]